MIGTKVIANRTDLTWGYVRGDTLEIIDDKGVGNVVIVRNLTRINLRKPALIDRSEFEIIDSTNRLIGNEEYVIKVFGIPIIRKTKGRV